MNPSLSLSLLLKIVNPCLFTFYLLISIIKAKCKYDYIQECFSLSLSFFILKGIFSHIITDYNTQWVRKMIKFFSFE